MAENDKNCQIFPIMLFPHKKKAWEGEKYREILHREIKMAKEGISKAGKFGVTMLKKGES